MFALFNAYWSLRPESFTLTWSWKSETIPMAWPRVLKTRLKTYTSTQPWGSETRMETFTLPKSWMSNPFTMCWPQVAETQPLLTWAWRSETVLAWALGMKAWSYFWSPETLMPLWPEPFLPWVSRPKTFLA